MSNPKPIKEQLVDLLNAQLAANGIETEYDLADLTFGAPEAYDPETIDESEPESANTSVLVTYGEGFEQVQYRLHYCRLDIATLLAPREASFLVEEEPTSTHDVLTEVSEHVNFELTAADLVDSAVTAGVVTIKAAPGSFAVRGEGSLEVEVLEGT